MMADDWPAAELDNVRRLHVLASGIRGANVVEQVITAPYSVVWPALADLEGAFGQVLPDMRDVRVIGRDGDRVTASARSRFGMRALLRGEQSDGWCWLQSRFLLIGVAARAEGVNTRVAIAAGLRVPGRAAVVPVGVRREAARSLARLQRLVG